MNRKNLVRLLITAITPLFLLGCSNTQSSEEKDNSEALASLEQIEAPAEEISQETEDEEDLNYDEDLGDIDLAYHDEDYEEPVGALCKNLEELEYLKEPMLFRNDLDAYLKYYLPYIDHEYDAYVLKGTEKNTNALYSFKINVEKIMEDGSDLEIRCILEGGYDHYNFFSELTPNGTDEIIWGAGLIDDSEFK